MGIFFFGMGYSSRATARALHELRDPDLPIAGTTRSAEGAEAFADSNYRIHVFNGEAPGATLGEDLRQATHVILSIPPDERGDPALKLHRADLDAAHNLQWIGYFSTVGVYGDFGGQWIDETASTRPVNVRSRQRVDAEQANARRADLQRVAVHHAGAAFEHLPLRAAFCGGHGHAWLFQMASRPSR